MPNERFPYAARLASHGPTVLLRVFNVEMKKVILGALRDAGWRPVDFPDAMEIIPQGCDPVGAIVDLPLDDDRMEWLRAFDFPIVRLGILPHTLDGIYPAVLMDHAGAGRLAADHFIERGYRHVGFVAPEWEHAHLNYAAFKERLAERGATCEFFGIGSGQVGRTAKERQWRLFETLRGWLQSQRKPAAVYTYAKAASTICMIASSEGLAIPEEVAVLAFDNAMLATQADLVDLSAIDLGYDAFGTEAVRVLGNLVAGGQAPSRPTFIPPNGVVERHSTNALAVSDPVVAKALRYVWDNLHQQVSIVHVARQVGVSRSTLERKFRRCLGRSINAERHRKRLSRCAELLLSTDLTIADIGALVGIPNNSYLHRSFLTVYGVTPRQYRLQSGG